MPLFLLFNSAVGKVTERIVRFCAAKVRKFPAYKASFFSKIFSHSSKHAENQRYTKEQAAVSNRLHPQEMALTTKTLYIMKQRLCKGGVFKPLKRNSNPTFPIFSQETELCRDSGRKITLFSELSSIKAKFFTKHFFHLVEHWICDVAVHRGVPFFSNGSPKRWLFHPMPYIAHSISALKHIVA